MSIIEQLSQVHSTSDRKYHNALMTVDRLNVCRGQQHLITGCGSFQPVIGLNMEKGKQCNLPSELMEADAKEKQYVISGPGKRGQLRS